MLALCSCKEASYDVALAPPTWPSQTNGIPAPAAAQAQSQYQPPTQHKRRQQQQVPASAQQKPSDAPHDSAATGRKADTACAQAAPAPARHAPVAVAAKQQASGTEAAEERAEQAADLQRATAAFDAGKAAAHKQQVSRLAAACWMCAAFVAALA